MLLPCPLALPIFAAHPSGHKQAWPGPKPLYDPERPDRSDLDMDNRELRVHGKDRRDRIVKFDYDAAAR